MEKSGAEIGVINVGEIVPDHMSERITMQYADRAHMLGCQLALFPDRVSPQFNDYVQSTFGVTPVTSLPDDAQCECYVPTNRLPSNHYHPKDVQWLAGYRLKAHVVRDFPDLVPAQTHVLARHQLWKLPLLLAKHRMLVGRYSRGDGGFGLMVLTPDLRQWRSTFDFLYANDSELVVAPLLKDVVARPGISFTDRFNNGPNGNLQLDGLGSIGTYAPDLSVLFKHWWLDRIMRLNEQVADRIRSGLTAPLKFASADYIVTDRVSLLEINARYSNFYLLVRALYTWLSHHGENLPEFDEFLHRITVAQSPWGLITSDKVACPVVDSFGELCNRLESNGLPRFDGRRGWIATHDVWHLPEGNYAGLAFYARTDSPRESLRQVATELAQARYLLSDGKYRAREVEHLQQML